jgi:hypothetical protein
MWIFISILGNVPAIFATGWTGTSKSRMPYRRLAGYPDKSVAGTAGCAMNSGSDFET